MLAPDGAIARRLGDGFEARPQQVAMAEAVASALARRGRLLVEAGTGVGKSFAYLLPAIARVVEHRERVVVATNTIALQEQLLEKDVPLLRAALPEEFTAVLVKGRGNYLSLRRLEMASKRQETLLPDFASRTALHAIEDWAYSTTDGTLATLPQLERPAVWDRVQSDAGNCMGRRCPTYEKCFFQQARRRMERGDLLICNHALFFSDLALRQRGVGFLPDYDHVILDEAHCVEDVATDHFGRSVGEGRIMHLVGLLFHERTRKGFLANLMVAPGSERDLERAVDFTMRAAEGARVLFDRVAQAIQGRGRAGDEQETVLKMPEPGMFENTVTPVFAELALSLKRLREGVAREEDRYELNSYAERAAAIADDADALLTQAMPACAYWAEAKRVERGSGATSRVTIACSPVEVGPILKEALFGTDSSVILTSATMTTREGDFRHLAERVGCEIASGDSPGAQTLHLGSPFDFASQVELHLDETMPDPRERSYPDVLAERVLEHVRATLGGAFVLFTSFATLKAVDRRIRDELEAEGYTVCAQGRDGPRGVLLARFRAAERGVLLGAASFWQGVDVQGAALRNVIITRLPFEPPDRPLVEARGALLKSRGRDPFFEDALPRSVLRFKQGFGRLVRSARDEGRVVVLDPRVVTKRYGRAYLAALPEGVRVIRRQPEPEPFEQEFDGGPDGGFHPGDLGPEWGA
jgi:ATP-dependent DNA helicase DinG